MNLIERCYIKRQIKKDEYFLIRQGIRKSLERGIELKLQESEKGEVDVTHLVASVANDYPEITDRYLANKRKLVSLKS